MQDTRNLVDSGAVFWTVRHPSNTPKHHSRPKEGGWRGTGSARASRVQLEANQRTVRIPKTGEDITNTQAYSPLPKHAHDVPHVRPPVLGRPHHFTTEPIDATYFILEGRDAAATPKIVALRRDDGLSIN